MSGFVHEAAVSNSVEWYTPKSVFDALGVGFDLDVCSPGLDKTWVPAEYAFTIEDDGLTSPWAGFVWCNPPYGKGIDKWISRMAEHDNGIALLPARPDTAWFYEMSETACLVKFVRGRIRFHPGDKHAPNTGSPGAGNVLAAWGAYASTVLSESNIKGRLFMPIRHKEARNGR